MSRENDLASCDGHRILVVDDEPSVRKLFSAILSSSFPDSTIDMAENGEVAFDSFCHAHQKMLLMDLSMPILDGERSFRKIEQFCQSRHWEMPDVLFCTGYASPDTVDKLLKQSPHLALVRKPLTGSQLVEAIKALQEKNAE